MSQVGRRFGSFTIQSLLGAGGMGEVYRAHDSKLGRDVAIKIVAPALLLDAERRARFDREARALASLNHPHIGAIYGVEDAGDSRALILELVEGPTIAERLASGPLSVKDALAAAAQIADALDAAHQAGIIHRDLKPANIKVRPDGLVKVLDFGIAKIVGTDASPGPTHAATATQGTREGLVIGSAAYMSPEQARGAPIDKRTDIWAFGCVLYEMLTGRGTFAGPTQSDTIAALLAHEPDWQALPAATPRSVVHLLHRCLEKDAARRLRDIGDARWEIEEARSDRPSQTDSVAASAPSARRVPVAVVVAAVLAATVAGATAWLLKPSPAPANAAVTRLMLALPPGETLGSLVQPTLAVSPDGRMLAYTASRDGSALNIFVRGLDRPEATLLAGTDGAYAPFFSPDGQWIGFFAQGKLKKVLADGGGLQTLSDAAIGLGGSWSRDDTIYFSRFNTSGIWRVSANGGMPQEFTRVDRSEGEVSHRWPQILDDGRTLLFTAWTGPGWDERHLVVQVGDGAEHRVLVRGASTGRYVRSGHLAYSHADQLIVVPFDSTALGVTGTPVTLIDHVAEALGEGAQFAVSDSGTLAYVAADPRAFERTLVWVSRDGSRESIPAPPGAYTDPAISPDGRFAATSVQGPMQTLWIYDFARSTLTTLAASGSDQAPKWTPDGRRLVYRGTRAGFRTLYWRAADGSGEEERLTVGENLQAPGTVAPDGATVLFQDVALDTGFDIWVAGLTHPRQPPRPLVRTRFQEMAPQVSPDGRLLAYVSNESGREQIYVQPLPDLGTKMQISTEGGAEPRWSRDGREIFYRNGDRMMGVSLATKGELTASAPHLIFEGRFQTSDSGSGGYDVASDGRFLMVQPGAAGQPATQIHVVLNWFGEIGSRLSAPAR